MFLFSSLQQVNLTPTFAVDNATQGRLPNIDKRFNADNFTKCPPEKVPIHRINPRHQVNIDLSSERDIKDFHQYSESSPDHHVSR